MATAIARASTRKDHCMPKTHAKVSKADQRVEASESSRVPNFLAKIYELVDDNTNEYIYWNPTGKGFVVDQPNKFSELILPLYFKTNQFASFVR